MKSPIPLLILASIALLSGCSAVPDSRGSGGRTDAPIATSQTNRQCLAQLGQAGASFTPLPDRYTGEGCSIVGTVQMNALRTDIATTALTNLGPVQCEVANAFAGWARYGVDRAAQQILGSRLRSIETMGSYSCRNVAGSGRRSAHATAEAIDVGAFVLEDGRRISVLGDWSSGTAAERRFLRTVHESACKRFGTVLGPDYNAAHENHFHLEGVGTGNAYCR